MDIILEPIYSDDMPYAGVEKELSAYFDEAIFRQLFDVLKLNKVKVPVSNALGDSVVEALNRRRIWYSDGVFSGQFSAAISRDLRRMGATWDDRGKVFRLPQDQLPNSVRLATAQSLEASKTTARQLLEVLKQMEANLTKAPTGLRLVKPVNDILEDLQKQFGRTLAKRGIGVPADLSETTKQEIFNRYTANLDLAIKNFSSNRLPLLRKRVEQVVFEGARTDKLAKIIQAEQGISKRKAAFLAEQETSLLVSKYREARYKQVGSRRYVWKTSRDSRVRHDHKELNGKIFSWDQPPITNRQTGARNNPGEDYGCRCVARPILSIQE